MKKTPTGQAGIGKLIRNGREARGMSQTEFAKLLKTSQSAVARMEQGNQNFSTALLEKIGNILGRRVVTVPSGLDFRIHGGRTLGGDVTINTSKNGAMGLLCASLLNHGTTILHGIPHVEETARMKEVLISLGVSVRDIGLGSVEIKVPESLTVSRINASTAAKMRSSIMLWGPLASRFKRFTLPISGGCKMGSRSDIAHVQGLRSLGITVREDEKGCTVDAMKARAGEAVLFEMSDTGTENLLMAAAGLAGTTTIRFAASNYMVQDMCHFLRALGVGVSGIGTTTLVVHGSPKIDRTVEYYNSEDTTEAMLFVSIAAATHSHLFLRRCPIDFLQLEMIRLRDMGLRFKMSGRYKSRNGITDLVDIEAFPSKLVAPRTKIYAQPYPGINTDNLPFFVPIATQAVGTTLIHDWMWENRAIYFAEMNRLGAKVSVADPHRVFIEGPTKLAAAQVVCPPALRPSAIILVGMLAAEGTSILRNVYSINRGYEDLAHRLNQLGAKVEALHGIAA
jgi:UDP-N-acetylglucosamine 1-carboxyvinyltransferase